MQVDKGIRGSSWDVADLFHSDLFSSQNNNNNNNNNTISSSSSSAMSNASSPSSREATPLPTPPSISLGEQFPDHHHHHPLTASSSSSNLQSPDALYGFYDSSPRASTSSNDARELLGATGPKSSGGFMGGAYGANGMGVGAPNPFTFPMDDTEFNAYMTGLEEAYGITIAPAAGTSPSSSSSSGHSPHQAPSQTSTHTQPTQQQQQQQGMEMMYGFNNMDLEMMSLPISLDGSFMPGSGNPFAGIPMMGMSIDPADPSALDSMSMGLNMNIGIDPQLVDSPAPLVSMDDDEASPQEEEEEAEDNMAADDGDDEDEVEAPAPAKRGRKKKTDVPAVNTSSARRSARKSNATDTPSPTSPTSDKEKLTLTIAPVKVGGRGTALGRRGTVMSGGVSKRGAVPAASSVATSALGSTATPLSERSNTPAPNAPAKRGRKPGPKKAAQEQEVQEAQVVVQPPVVAQTFPITSTSSLPVVPAQAHPTSLPTPTHTRTGSTSKPAAKPAGTGPGIPHSSSGLGIVPPPLPNGQKHLTPVDLGLGKTFAFAIPMGTFNGGVGGVVPPASTSTTSPTTAAAGASGATAQAQGQGQHTSPLQAAMSEFGGDEEDEGGAGGGAYPVDWRPSPEVFAKMSSKEKRQLRNKISARNFRVRRKEYISTLEGDIAERDRLLEAIRNELGSSRNENLALRREVENLKRVLLNGRGVDASADSLDNLPPPAPLPEKSAAEMLAAQAASPSSSSSALFKPNTQKDLPTSPRNGNNSFWAGSMSGGMLGGGGVTAVHTTFVPAPVVVGLGGSPGGLGSPNLGVFGPAWTQPSPFAPALQENMNPLMRSENINPHLQAQEENQRKVERERSTKMRAEQKENSFEGFADSNMFTMKNMDTYRMHLWGKMAAQYHAHHQQQQHQARAIAPSPSPSPQLPYAAPQQQQGEATSNIYHPNLLQLQQLAQQQQQLVQSSQLQGLAARMERSWFKTPTTPPSSTEPRVPLGTTTNLVALLSGKGSVLGSSSSYPGSTYKRSSGKGGDETKPVQTLQQQQQQQEMSKKQQEQAQAAMLAVVASQTILRKLGQAFWDAFSGSTSSSTAGATPGGVARRFEAGRAPQQTTGQQAAGASGQRPDWDADKVRKVLDGTAVLRIVDVDQLHKLDGPAAASSSKASSSSIPPTVKSSSTTSPVAKEEMCSAAACWAQCSREWCSTDTLRNVSKGGSVSVPASPALRPVAPAMTGALGGGSGLASTLNASKEAKQDEHSRKMTALLEEGMKGLRL